MATAATMSATATTTLTTSELPLEGQPGMLTAEEKQSGCPQCGFDLPSAQDSGAAQQRVEELETQIRNLNEKAVTTAEKLAAYEDEIHSLRSRVQQNQPRHTQSNSNSSATAIPTTPTFKPPSPEQSPPQQQQQQQQQTRLGAFASSFLPYGRRPSTASPEGPTRSLTSPSPGTNGADPSLQDALSREQALRKSAESRLTQANSELEDLTAQLFGQANEMVAQERKARSKLEERVEVLERRDGEKRRRLERLEKAIERVDRIRGMVGAK